MNTQHAHSVEAAPYPDILRGAVDAFLLPAVQALGTRRLLRCLPADAGDRVLELSCSGADNLLYLAGRRRGLRLFGLAADQARCAEARLRVSRAGAGADIRLGTSPEDLGFSAEAEACFDTLFRTSPEPLTPGDLAWSLGLLKPGGLLLALDLGRPVWRSGGIPAPAHSRVLRDLDAVPRGSTLGTLAAASRDGAVTLSWDSFLGGRACLAVARRMAGDGDGLEAPGHVAASRHGRHA